MCTGPKVHIVEETPLYNISVVHVIKVYGKIMIKIMKKMNTAE